MMLRRKSVLNPMLRYFSQETNLASLHRVKHMGVTMDPKFYEKDFMITNVAEEEEDIKMMRSPFYEFAKEEHMSGEEAA